MKQNEYRRHHDNQDIEMEKRESKRTSNRLSPEADSHRRSSTPRGRSGSRSPLPPARDDWNNPSNGERAKHKRDSRKSQTSSSDVPERRQSQDDAYGFIREASFKKTPSRRASEPANKPRYPPPPKLETYPTQPRSFLWLAMLTVIANFFFGIPALVCAITSDNAWAAGKRDEAKRRGRYALIIGIIGILITIIIIIAVPVSYKYLSLT